MNTHSHFNCDSCGGELAFQPNIQELECPYCGKTQKIPAQNKEIQEHSFEDALREKNMVSLADLSTQEIECKNCGAQILTAKAAQRCPFCDSPVVLHEQSPNLIRPESILPFQIDGQKAKDMFQNWLKSRWFAPNDLVARAKKDGLDGIYVPYWTYDSDTQSQYSGERGDHYYEEETYQDASGEEQTRSVQKTDWTLVSGNIQENFDDVLICASKALPQKLFDGLKTWQLTDLKPFDPGFLSGFLAQRYAIDLKEGFSLAKKKMDHVIRQKICYDIGGDEQRISHVDTQFFQVTYKHILLPLWISSFRYNNKVYRFIVNAQTGEVTGERPFSMIKIVLLILFIVAVIVTLINM